MTGTDSRVGRRVAVVTGGAGPGIGSAISARLALDGLLVWVLDVDGLAADRLAAHLDAEGLQAHGAECDVEDSAAVAATFEKIASGNEEVRALVNSAGVGLNKRLGEVTEQEYDRLMGVDLRGAWVVTRAVLPLMVAAGGGSIVNIGSVHALGAEAGHGVYAAAKAGMVAMTRAVAHDYGIDGVRCNIVHPGAVDTPQTRALSRARGEDPETWLADLVSRRQLLQRLVTPEDVAAAVSFLVSDDSEAITGATLVVDGGLHAMLWDRT